MTNREILNPDVDLNRRRLIMGGLCVGFGLSIGYLPKAVAAQVSVYLPILVPVSGFMSLGGSSQRNGAQMAVAEAPKKFDVKAPVFDTGTSATGASSALDRALSQGSAVAACGSIFGTEMLVMAPLAQSYQVPILTLSGLPKLTESGNDYVFRFLPNDRGMKAMQARYAIEELGKSKPVLFGDTTAYGQEGFDLLRKDMEKLGVKPVLTETVEPTIKNMSSIVAKIKVSGADVLVIHAVGQPEALLIRQCRRAGLDIPIVASSSIVLPPALALLEPSDLENLFAETPSSPEAPTTDRMKAWAKEYRSRFNVDANGIALAQYDSVKMTLHAIGDGARSAADVVKYLNTHSYDGVAMTYQSNGKGDMAHDGEIVGWDGTSYTPKIMKHYDLTKMLAETGLG